MKRVTQCVSSLHLFYLKFVALVFMKRRRRRRRKSFSFSSSYFHALLFAMILFLYWLLSQEVDGGGAVFLVLTSYLSHQLLMGEITRRHPYELLSGNVMQQEGI